MPSFGSLGALFKILPFSAQNEVSTIFVVDWNPNICVAYEPIQISEPHDNPYWDLSYGLEKKEED